jgi:catechol 2,3-dioxygenase-like lactoylglutathione lyase family enzyme
MSNLHSASPQFLVADLKASIAYYEHKLGFRLDFVYDGFYAGIGREAATIHLKEAPQHPGERAHRKSNEHLDAYIAVTDATPIYADLQARGANIIRALEMRPWGVRDYYVEDPDAYILCFGEMSP